MSYDSHIHLALICFRMAQVAKMGVSIDAKPTHFGLVWLGRLAHLMKYGKWRWKDVLFTGCFSRRCISRRCLPFIERRSLTFLPQLLDLWLYCFSLYQRPGEDSMVEDRVWNIEDIRFVQYSTVCTLGKELLLLQALFMLAWIYGIAIFYSNQIFKLRAGTCILVWSRHIPHQSGHWIF